MFYLSQTNVVSAWQNLVNNGGISNKFFGLLQVFSVLNIHLSQKISPKKQYQFKSSNLSNSLQKLFTFKGEKNYKSDDIYHVVFSEKWYKVVLEEFLGTHQPNILDVAIICLQNRQFEKELSSVELVDLFIEEYHLTREVVFVIFYENFYDLKWNSSEINRTQLKKSLWRTFSKDESFDTLGFEGDLVMASNAGELARASFFQTLYASQGALKCLVCTKFDFLKEYGFPQDLPTQPVIINKPTFKKLPTLQKIYFGSPGTGKSRALENFAKENNLEIIRTTFHPDTDYQSFVGGYKPVMNGENISYQFVPQAFTKAYTKAYANPEQGYLLAIEEINRGNCASVFGDIFQCLDRDSAGFSTYESEADAELGKYLESVSLENKIKLPPNLLIYATMNTSDQSLFPMDAAFKRRWEWEYVPIDMSDAEQISVQIDEETSFLWSNFIAKINKQIHDATKSDDKKLGNRFVSPKDENGKLIISKEQFVNKVMFYLWTEVYKDEHESGNTIFKSKEGDVDTIFSYNELFVKEGEYDLVKLKGFLEFNGIIA